MMTAQIKTITTATLLLLTQLSSSLIFADSGINDSNIHIEQAWIAEAPPMSKVMAGYLKIENKNQQEVNIISVQSKSFERIEFHQTQHQNDIAQMRQLDQLKIPANSKLLLQAGGIHLMLFKPIKRLKSGDKVIYTFKSNNGKSITAIASVKKLAATHSQHSHQHH